MWLVVGTALLALAAGAGLGALGSRRMLYGAQAFAVTSVLAVVVTHLLPDAIEARGWPALLLFLVCLVAPHALVQLLQRSPGAGESTLNLAFLGILVHQLGDGLAYAATGSLTSGRGMVLLGQFAHTLPLGLMVMLLARSESNARAGWTRIGVLMAATAAGAGLGVGLGLDTLQSAAPWVSASVAGLLVHVVLHVQPPGTPPDALTRASEVLAVAAGLALAWAGGLAHASTHSGGHAHAHDQVATSLLEASLRTAEGTAPALMVGLAVLYLARVVVSAQRSVPDHLPTFAWWHGLVNSRLAASCSALSPATLLLSLYALGGLWTACWFVPALALRQLLVATELPDKPWLGPINAHLAWWLFGIVTATFLVETMPESSPDPVLASVIATGVVAVTGIPTIAVIAAAGTGALLPTVAFGAALGASATQLRGTRMRERLLTSILGGLLGWMLAPATLPTAPVAVGLAIVAVAIAGCVALLGVWQHGLLAWVDALTPEQEHEPS